MSDAINHPSHYASGKVEVIEAIEDWKMNFHKGNAIKYIARAGKKDPTKEIEDLEKSIWYLRREIETLSARWQNRPPVRPNDMKDKTKAVATSVTDAFVLREPGRLRATAGIAQDQTQLELLIASETRVKGTWIAVEMDDGRDVKAFLPEDAVESYLHYDHVIFRGPV